MWLGVEICHENEPVGNWKNVPPETKHESKTERRNCGFSVGALPAYCSVKPPTMEMAINKILNNQATHNSTVEKTQGVSILARY